MNRRLRDLNSCEPLRGIAWYGLKRALPDRRHAREYERQRRAPVPLDRVMPSAVGAPVRAGAIRWRSRPRRNVTGADPNEVRDHMFNW